MDKWNPMINLIRYIDKRGLRSLIHVFDIQVTIVCQRRKVGVSAKTPTIP